MPYIRKGRKVYRKDTGELVGESETVEKAKKYLKALYAHAHDVAKGVVLYLDRRIGLWDDTIS